MASRTRIRQLSTAIILAITAIIISYYFTNLNLSLSGEKPILKYWCAFADWITSGSERASAEDVVFINVSNDKQLVDVADMFGIPTGNAAITDRAKLRSLLEIIESSSYQYVLLDVFFEEGYNTEEDSALFSLISRMDRIVIPKHTDGSIAPLAPVEKASYSEYNVTINEDDFTKLQLLWKDGESIPLRMYSDLTGRTVRKTALWYSDKGALARKVIFPKMYVRIDSPYRSDGEKAYLNLGVDVLNYAEGIDWSEFFADKIIVIGAFKDEDIHTTYAWDMPGCLINYNVFLSLMKGQHKIPLGLIIFYFLVFFTMAYLLVSKEASNTQPWAWLWAKLFVIYSAVLTIICIFVFVVWGQAHDIFITSTFFSVVDAVSRHLKTKKKDHA